jgi:hypothetical protein
MAAVPRDFKKMVLSDDPNDVVNRIQGYLELVEARKDGGQEAVSRFRMRLLKDQPLS